jgi:hypothetical protein
VMRDPVVAADGHTYERAAIQRWFKGHNTSPVTNVPVPHKHLNPNIALRAIIRAHLEHTERGTECI